MSLFFRAAAKCDHRLIAQSEFSVDRAFDALRERSCSVTDEANAAAASSSTQPATEKRHHSATMFPSFRGIDSDHSSEVTGNDHLKRARSLTRSHSGSMRMLAKSLADNSHPPPMPKSIQTFQQLHRLESSRSQRGVLVDSAASTSQTSSHSSHPPPPHPVQTQPIAMAEAAATAHSAAAATMPQTVLPVEIHSPLFGPMQNDDITAPVVAVSCSPPLLLHLPSLPQQQQQQPRQKTDAEQRCFALFARVRRFSEELDKRNRDLSLLQSDENQRREEEGERDAHRAPLLLLQVEQQLQQQSRLSRSRVHVPQGITDEARAVMAGSDGIVDFLEARKQAQKRAAALLEQQTMQQQQQHQRVTVSVALQRQQAAAKAKVHEKRLEKRDDVQAAARDKLVSLCSIHELERCEHLNHNLMMRRLEKAGQERSAQEQQQQQSRRKKSPSPPS